MVRGNNFIEVLKGSYIIFLQRAQNSKVTEPETNGH